MATWPLTYPKQRGLRQGDPLSPILFNLAFEPFLNQLLYDSELQGHRMSYALPATLPSVKYLAYADDVIVFLSSPLDLHRFFALYESYARASNAKINTNKTITFSLSGRALPDWQTALQSHGISRWHDRLSTHPLIYLGFPLYSSKMRRDIFFADLLRKISDACHIYSQRTLSIGGRSTVINTLILCKLWHVLRVTTFTVSQMTRIRSIATKFLTET